MKKKLLLGFVASLLAGAIFANYKTVNVKADVTDYEFVLNNGTDIVFTNEIPEVPTFDDHVFMGFYEYPGSDEQIIDASGVLVSGKNLTKNKTYYARWKVSSDANSKDILCSPVEVSANGFNYWKCNDILTSADNYGISFEAAQGTKGDADYVPAKLILDNLYCAAQDMYSYFEFTDDVEVVIKGNCLIDNNYYQGNEGVPIGFLAAWDDTLANGEGDYTDITITGYDENAYLTINNMCFNVMAGNCTINNLNGEASEEEFMAMISGFIGTNKLTFNNSKFDFNYQPYEETNFYYDVIAGLNAITIYNSELSFVCNGSDKETDMFIMQSAGEILFEDSKINIEANFDGDPREGANTAVIFGSMDSTEFTGNLTVKNSNLTIDGDVPNACVVNNASFENSNVIINNKDGITCKGNLSITDGGSFEAKKASAECTITIGNETLPAEVTNIDGFETSDGVTDKQELTPTSGTTFKVTFPEPQPEPQPQPTPEEEEQPCYVHFITIGLLILSLVAFILGVYVLKNKLVQIVSIATLLVGSIVISVFSKCLICFIALGINGILGLLAVIYLIVRKEKEEEKK